MQARDSLTCTIGFGQWTRVVSCAGVGAGETIGDFWVWCYLFFFFSVRFCGLCGSDFLCVLSFSYLLTWLLLVFLLCLYRLASIASSYFITVSLIWVVVFSSSFLCFPFGTSHFQCSLGLSQLHSVGLGPKTSGNLWCGNPGSVPWIRAVWIQFARLLCVHVTAPLGDVMLFPFGKSSTSPPSPWTSGCFGYMCTPTPSRNGRRCGIRG